MSVLAAPLPHQPFSDTELYVSQGGSVDLPPVPTHLLPIAVPGPSVPFPSFQQRHTSPYPMAEQHSFSALGPSDAESSTSSINVVPPPAPKYPSSNLPAVTPDLHPNPQTPLPPTPEASPPTGKVLGPTMMIKLAPPADDDYEYQYGQVDVEAHRALEHLGGGSSHHSRESSGSTSTTPRRIPGIAVNTALASQIPPRELQRTPSPRIRNTAGLSSEPMAKSVSSEGKAPRPKSMGAPPRPRRTQTAHGHPQATRMAESRSADSRAKLRASNAIRASSFGAPGAGGSNSANLARAINDTGIKVVSGRKDSAVDMAPPDLGGPEGLEAKVVLLGSQGVGKTSLILRYTTRAFSPTPAPATIGSSLHTRKLVHSGVRVKLQIWDTAGQERFRSMAPIYYRGAHVCVLVYDISDWQSFEDVRSWLEELGKSVPKETVIFVVGAKTDLGAKRQVSFEVAKETIRSWIKPPYPPPARVPPPLQPPPQRSLFRASTTGSRHDSPSSTPHTAPPRPRSYIAYTPTPQPQPTPIPVSRSNSVGPSVPFPSAPSGTLSPDEGKGKEREDVSEKRRRRHSSRPFPVKISTSTTSPNLSNLASSPTRLEFPSLQSPSRPTSATFTEPISSPNLPVSGGRHRSSNSRFSISGISEVLGLGRTVSMSGAVHSLQELAEAPKSPNPLDSSLSFSTSSTDPSPARVRTESSPHFASYDPTARQTPPLGSSRRSDEWARGGGWRMGEGPGAAEALGEFGAGVRRKESEELLGVAAMNKSLPALGSGGYKMPPSSASSTTGVQGRGRGGSLGRDPRLIGDVEAKEDGWGVEVEGVRLGECSAATGDGIEALFKVISSILVDRKDKIERERILKHKHSVILVDPTANPTSNKKEKAGCCV
ncbi:hypothetical protein IAR50_005639 [Cryptococcus sp. DSM 104548]